MSAVLAALGWVGARGRVLLVLGLVAGVLLEDLAQILKPYIAEGAALLLGLAALRIGLRQATGALGDLAQAVGAVLALQLLAPLLAIAALHALGLAPGPAVAAALLVLAAAPLSGSPSLCILAGQPPAPALRLVVAGTALLPLTVLPVFAAWPLTEGGVPVLAAVARLLGVILVAAGVGFALRAAIGRRWSPAAQGAVDGLSAIALAVMVVGLMHAIGAALRGDPMTLLRWLGLACLVNFGAQAVGAVLARLSGRIEAPGSLGIVAGNRNIALFLVALPEPVTAPLMIFIGCYQVPMFLTPILFAPVLRLLGGAPRAA